MYTFTISRKEFQQAVMDGENPVLMGLKEQHGVDGFMLPYSPHTWG